jgi:RHS repeat-associated protein
MGKPGAKKLDLITSTTPGDVHVLLVMGAPTPIPHPVPSSIIKDRVANSVKVEGQPGAVKGSKSKHTPPHIPQGGSWTKPPSNQGEIFITTSVNVLYEGKNAAVFGDTAMMCCDPSDMPVGKVMGNAATVLVAATGSGTGDDDRAAAAQAAMAKAAEGTGAGAPAMNQVTGEGHPVDVVTGNVIAQGEDLDLDGPLPVQFVRTYVSSRAAVDGPLGHGWAHNFQEEIEPVEQGHPEWERVHAELTAAGNPDPDVRYLVYRDPNGQPTAYRALADGGRLRDPFRRRTLERVGRTFQLTLAGGGVRRFARVEGSGTRYLPVEVADRKGNVMRLRYDRAARPVEIEDPYQRTVCLVYDDRRLVELRLRLPGRPERRWCSYSYDDRGDLVAVLDRADFRTRYAYADHLLVMDRNRDGYAFHFAYDAERRCVQTWGEDGYLTRHLRFDPSRRRTHVVNGEGEHTVYSYTDAGVVQRIEKGGALFSESLFDELGRVIERSSGAGVIARMTYGDAGELLAIADADGNETTYTYNEFGQATSLTDALGAVTTHEYDERGNMTARTLPGGATTRWVHDARGRIVEEIRANGRRITIAYDEFGHPREVSDGSRRLTYRYDALGQLVRYTPCDGPERTYEWNEQGYPFRMLVGDQVTAAFEYSPEGYLLSDRDAHGTVRRFAYGPPGVAVETTTHDSGPAERAILRTRLTITRDSEGRPVTVTDQDGLVRTSAYDAAGHLVRETDPDGTVRHLTRDGAGRVVEIRDNRGTAQRTMTDGRGAPLRIEYADGTHDAFEYDELGRVTSATNAWGTVGFEYDAEGRQTVRRQGDFEILADVAPDGRRMSWTWPDGPTTTFTAASGGILDSIEFAGRRIDFEFDGSRLPARRALPNGLVESYEFDALGRQVRYELRGARDSLVTRHIEYDGYRIARIRDSAAGDREFHYDVHGRLVRVAGAAQEEYRYDARDNLVASHRFRESYVEGPDLLRRADARQLDYDERGRVVELRREDGVLRFGYDAKGDLTSVDLPDGGSVTYRYDVFGRRVEKVFRGGSRDGTRVRFCWNDDDLVKEERWNGDELYEERCYLFASHVPIARLDRRGGTERAIFYHTDHVGTPRLCTDEQGEVVWRSAAEAFGHDASASTFQPLCLPGQYFDEETGLHYNRFRYYDPFTTRYLQPDPLHTIADPNRYGYPLDPLTRSDPLGLSSTRVINADPADGALIKGEARDRWAAAGVPVSDMFGDDGMPDLTGVDHVVIYAHGNPWEIGRSTPEDRLKGKVAEFSPGMSGRELAQYLKARGFTGSRVTLISCQTGLNKPGGQSFAQDVADELGGSTEVKSWRFKTTTDANGEVRCINPNGPGLLPPGTGQRIFTAGGPHGGKPGDFTT